MLRRGYILVFVLGITTVVTALGLSYISSNGTVMQQATNRYAAIRAQYVAESGAVLAQHFIHYPPTTVARDVVYPGATGVALDSTFDTVDITVTPTAPDHHYSIQARATVRSVNGTEALARQVIETNCIIPPEPKWKINQAALLSGAPTIASGVTLSGAIHSNGSVIGLGNCTGDVSATGVALWTGGGPPSSVSSAQPAVAAPPASPSLYTAYKINGTSYTAYTGHTTGILRSSDVAALNSAVNAGGTNPGRIVYCALGDFSIRDDVVFSGTLVVRGNLALEGTNISLNAVANYPAVVVTGDINFRKDTANMVVNGPVVCAGNLADDGKNNSQLTINGAVILGGSINRTGLGSRINIVWDSGKSTFWDLNKTANPEPFTALDWNEN